MLSFLAGMVAGALLVGLMPAWMVRALDNLRIALLGRVTAVGAKLRPVRFAGLPQPFGVPWKIIGLVLVALVVIGALRGCSLPFGLGKSPGELRLERELAEAEARTQEIINARDVEIAQAAETAAILRAENAMLLDRTLDEIDAATPDDEAPISMELASAWRCGITRLRNNASNAPSADSCGGVSTG